MAIHHLNKMYADVIQYLNFDRTWDASPLLSSVKGKPLTAYRLRPSAESVKSIEHENAFRTGFEIEHFFQDKLILTSPEGNHYAIDVGGAWMSLKYFLKMDMQNSPCAMLYDDVVRRTFLGTEAQYKKYVKKLERATEDLKKNGPKVGEIYQSYLGEPGPSQDVILIRYLGTFNNEAAWVEISNTAERIGPYFSTEEQPEIIARMIPLVAGEMRFLQDVRSPANMSLTLENYRSARAKKKGIIRQVPITAELWPKMIDVPLISIQVGNLNLACSLRPLETFSSRKTKVLMAALTIQPQHIRHLPELVEFLTKLGVSRETIEKAVSRVAPRGKLTADNRLTFDDEIHVEGEPARIHMEFQEDAAYDKPGRAFELFKDATVTVYDYFGKCLIKSS